MQHSRRRSEGQRRRGPVVDTIDGDDPTSAASANLPMVHPGAQLPPLHHRPLSQKRSGKFSFMSASSSPRPSDVYVYDVPNNSPKLKLPMWSSSLTSPALGRVRLPENNWISADAKGTIAPAASQRFVDWLHAAVPPSDATFHQQLADNIYFHVRRATARGVYAKRALAKGEVILSVPLTTSASCCAPCSDEATAGASTTTVASRDSSPALLTINAEVLAASSPAVQSQRYLPSRDDVHKVLNVRRSSFDAIPHPLFVDQVHTALLLACERAAGNDSSYAAFFEMLPADLFDKDEARQLHVGVVDARSLMEYDEQCGRFQHFLRELHRLWCDRSTEVACRERDAAGVPRDSSSSSSSSAASPAALDIIEFPSSVVSLDIVESPCSAVPGSHPLGPTATGDAVASEASVPFSRSPPSLEQMEWAFRVVLSRHYC